VKLTLVALHVVAIALVTRGTAQNLPPATETKAPATVTLYRTGKASFTILTKVDGVEIAKLVNHKQVTFKVAPGYHELSAKAGAWNPFRVFSAEPGQQLFFALDFEGPTVIGAFHPQDMTIAPVSAILDSDVKEEKLTDDNLQNILLTANPSGSEPNDAISKADPAKVLTSGQVKSAILQGMHDRYPGSVGISLVDAETALLSGMVVNGGVSGYRITVYTAETYIEHQAAEARELLEPFTEADVTPEMRQEVIFIFASPSVPGRLNAPGMAAASSAEHVVIADESKKIILQPVHEETSGVTVDSALRSKEFGAVGAMFTPEQIKRVQNKNGEFFVAVTGGYRKFFRVKQNSPMWRMLRSYGR
jgi:hypothetical protein